MKTLLLVLAVSAPSLAYAGQDCRTYKSGNETRTVCSNTSNPRALNTNCRSYRSGSVVKTSCS
jgi:hypothetical protein